MSVLVEALCLVIPRRALEVNWPGGTSAFLQAMCAEDCPSRRVMSDADLVSISFFTPEAADEVAEQLRDCGLLEAVDDRFQDFAFVDQRLGPTLPCPWLHWRQHPDGFTFAWLEGSEPSPMSAPADWEPEQSRRLVREDLRDNMERMLKLAEEGEFEIWLDYETGEIGRGLVRPEPETQPSGGGTSPRATMHTSTPPTSGAAIAHASEPDDEQMMDDDLQRIVAELEGEIQEAVRDDEALTSGNESASEVIPARRPTAEERMGEGLFDEEDRGAGPQAPRPPIENSYVVPGTRLVAGEYPGSAPDVSDSRRDQKLLAFLEAGVNAFIDLTGEADRLAPYAPALRALAGAYGVDLVYEQHSIRDMDVCDVTTMRRVLDAIDRRLSEGRTVYVHCWGGVGRTGMVVGCWLVRHGASGRDALAQVARLFATMSPAKVRRHASWGSPQTHEQRAVVERWKESRPSASPTTRAGKEKARRRTERAEIESAPPSACDSPDGAERPYEPLSAWSRRMHTRIRGCLLGGALGDALGWPVEFLQLPDIRACYGEGGIQKFDAAAQGGVGAITDDTQMTLFTAEGILRSTTRYMEYWAYDEPRAADWGGEHAPHRDVMWHAYTRWLQTQRARAGAGRGAEGEARTPGDPGWLEAVPGLRVRRAPGTTCLGAIAATRQGTVEAPLNDCKGCGGVMRVAPIGLVPTSDPFAYAVMAASLTHGHPSGYLSAGAFAQIVHDLLFRRVSLGEAVSRALTRLSTERGHEETSAALEGALAAARETADPTPERVERLGKGSTGEEALAIGVYCALKARDFAHGVQLAVNHSGDSDSTGSIAGALLGVQGGEYALPAEWLTQLELREVIAAVADDLLLGYGGGAGWRARYPGS